MAPVTNKYWQPVGNRLLQRAFRVLIPGLEGSHDFSGPALAIYQPYGENGP